MSDLKSLLSAVTGFFGHHVGDLDNLTGAVSAILDALPVNAETRAHITAMIDNVKTSAENITVALENTTFGPDPVTIRESDVETALSNVVKSGALDGIIAQAVAEYAASHPTVATVPETAAPIVAPANEPAA